MRYITKQAAMRILQLTEEQIDRIVETTRDGHCVVDGKVGINCRPWFWIVEAAE